MNNVEFDHEGYRKLLPIEDYKNTMRESDKKSRKHFISMAFNNKTDVFSRNFSSKMLNIFPKSDFCIHIQQFPENDSPSYLIYNTDITAFIQFRLSGKSENRYLEKIITYYGVLIEVEALHSFEKGMGAMLVNQLQNLADKLYIPIFLYDNNLKDELYYQNLGFLDTNKKGDYGEPLLLYKPNETEMIKKDKGIKSIFKKVFNIK